MTQIKSPYFFLYTTCTAVYTTIHHPPFQSNQGQTLNSYLLTCGGHYVSPTIIFLITSHYLTPLELNRCV